MKNGREGGRKGRKEGRKAHLAGLELKKTTQIKNCEILSEEGINLGSHGPQGRTEQNSALVLNNSS